MKTIILHKIVGDFAENKDLARTLRQEQLITALEKDQEITLDFENVTATTQSFIHALISDLIRKYGSEVLEKIQFKNCNETIKKIVSIVTDYMQQSEQ